MSAKQASVEAPIFGAAPVLRSLSSRSNSNDFLYTHDEQPWLDEDHRTSLILAGECQALLSASKTPPWMVSPMHIWRVRWELFVQMLIVFQAVVVPYELAFLSQYLLTAHGLWFALETLMLLAFLGDMLLNFRTGLLRKGKVDYDVRHVARSYLTSWFPLDFLAWLPSVLALVMAPFDEEETDGRSTAVARLGRSVKFTRVVRVLRVLQLARMARLRNAAQGLQLKLLHSEGLMRSLERIGCGLLVFLSLHLLACLWAAVAPLEEHLLEEEASRYLLALWWASCALTFGGQPAPRNDAERLLAVGANLASVAVVALAVGWSAAAVFIRAGERHELAQRLDVASRFAKDVALPKALALEVKRALQHSQQSKQSAREFRRVVEAHLSQDLCQRVHGWVHGHLLRRFPPFSREASSLFRGCTVVPDRFLSQLAYEAKVTTFMAGDRVASIGEKAETMVFVLEGSLLMLGPAMQEPQVLREKYWFGEPVLIFEQLQQSEHFRWTSRNSTRAASIVALEDCKLLEIGQDSFNDAVRAHGLLQCWLRPVIKHMESGEGTLGCSCCRQLDHWITSCPKAQRSPLERLHIARQQRNALDAERPRWLPLTGPGNLYVPPEKWGMRLRQWAAFVMTCCFTAKWAELEESTERNKRPGHVNLYQLNEHMVKPWTRGTGNSVALLMNNTAPLQAEVMISHAWGASILETLTALLAKASVSGLTLDTVVWFCTFAQYQAGGEGDRGPTLEQQLALDPFKRVIESRPPLGMFVVHTSTAELYGRLWCVYEVNEAKIADVPPVSAYSMGALEKLRDIDASGQDLATALRVDTSQASCFIAADDQRIRSEVLAYGGFALLDEKILGFRLASVTSFHAMFAKFLEWAGSGAQEKATFEGLTKVVHQAGVFVGLHCLAPYVEETRDAALAVQLMARAKEIMRLWSRTFPGGVQPPPCLDAAKIRRKPNPEDDEQVQQCLLDLRHFPFAVGLLEMAAGGNLAALLAQAAGLAEAADEAGKAQRLRKAFHEWTAGSLKMSLTDLEQLLQKLGLEHLEQGLERQFALADSNGDGLVDFLEFERWLTAKTW